MVFNLLYTSYWFCVLLLKIKTSQAGIKINFWMVDVLKFMPMSYSTQGAKDGLFREIKVDLKSTKSHLAREQEAKVGPLDLSNIS